MKLCQNLEQGTSDLHKKDLPNAKSSRIDGEFHQNVQKWKMKEFHPILEIWGACAVDVPKDGQYNVQHS